MLPMQFPGLENLFCKSDKFYVFPSRIQSSLVRLFAPRIPLLWLGIHSMMRTSSILHCPPSHCMSVCCSPFIARLINELTPLTNQWYSSSFSSTHVAWPADPSQDHPYPTFIAHKVPFSKLLVKHNSNDQFIDFHIVPTVSEVPRRKSAWSCGPRNANLEFIGLACQQFFPRDPTVRRDRKCRVHSKQKVPS